MSNYVVFRNEEKISLYNIDKIIAIRLYKTNYCKKRFNLMVNLLNDVEDILEFMTEDECLKAFFEIRNSLCGLQ